MLQQTQVSRVEPRWIEFMGRFPTPQSCAEAGSAAVIELWAGLGYNRRAVNLWRSAAMISDEFEGQVPNDLESLLRLPGVGNYTARAVQAFAFEHDVGVVDTNVGRILARWTGAPLGPKQAQELADEFVPAGRGWRWNQSMFDFAVAVCTKREPRCGSCSLAEHCGWGAQRAAGVEPPDPATTSAGVSAKQSRFEGSERQVRGRIVAALRTGPLNIEDIEPLGREGDSADDVHRIATSLVADGLAEEADGVLRLPEVREIGG